MDHEERLTDEPEIDLSAESLLKFMEIASNKIKEVLKKPKPVTKKIEHKKYLRKQLKKAAMNKVILPNDPNYIINIANIRPKGATNSNKHLNNIIFKRNHSLTDVCNNDNCEYFSDTDVFSRNFIVQSIPECIKDNGLERSNKIYRKRSAELRRNYLSYINNASFNCDRPTSVSPCKSVDSETLSISSDTPQDDYFCWSGYDRPQHQKDWMKIAAENEAVDKLFQSISYPFMAYRDFFGDEEPCWVPKHNFKPPSVYC